MIPVYLFRFHGKNSKTTGRPVIAEFMLYIPRAAKLIELAESICCSSIFSFYFKYWKESKTMRHADAILLHNDESDTRGRVELSEKCRKDYLTQIMNLDTTGAFLKEFNREKYADDKRFLFRESMLTLDYFPYRTYRKRYEVANRSWVFKLHVRNLKRSGSSDGSVSDVWITKEPIEIYISTEELCELAIAMCESMHSCLKRI